MLRNLLVALDGSPDTDAAVDLAISWVRPRGGTLRGLGIVDAPGILRPESTPVGGTVFKQRRDEALLTDAWARVQGFQARFAMRCREAGVVHETVVEEGEPYERILHQGQFCDLILLGLHGNFHFETSDRPDNTVACVVRDCPRPVVAVPATSLVEGAVVVAYDGSIQAARSLSAFVATGLAREREVRLVCIQSDDDVALEILEPARTYMATHEIDSTVVMNSSTSLDPATALLEAAGAPDVSLLVVGAYGQPRLREFIIGSVTRTLLLQSPRALFLYH